MDDRNDMMIETERLFIRSISESDIDYYCKIHTLINSPGTDNFRQSSGSDELIKTCLWMDLNRNNRFNTLMFLRGTENLCGQVCMQYTDTDTPEIGIDILPEFQNQGYGPEAIMAFVNWYAKAYGIQRVKIRIAEGNTHSRHVFEKLGAEYIGALPVFTDEYLDAVRQALPGSDITELEEAKVDTFFLSIGNSIS